LFDLNKNEFLKTKGSMYVENGFTNTFLYAIKDSLEPFKGYVTGKIDVAFDGSKVLFIIPESVFLKDFKLSFPQSTKPLLQNGGFKVENTTVTLDAKNNVGINANISMNETLLKINGVIDPEEINLVATDSKINMNAFGPISGVKINGSGPIDVKINGPYDDVRFAFQANWKKFSLLDLNFGDVKATFSLALSDVILSIDKLEGKFNQSQFDASGWLKFGDLSGLDLKLNFPNTNFADAKAMYALVFNGIKLPSDLAFKFETQYRIYGSYDLADLKFDGKIKARELKAYGEDFESATMGLSLNNKNLSFTNIKLKKGRGDIQGSANVSLSNNYAEVEASGIGIRLSDLNFYRKFGFAYDSDLSLEYDGNGTADNYSSRLKFRTIDPYIATYPASHSNGLIYLSSNDLVGKINMLGNKIKIDSVYDFARKEISFKSIIDTQDLKELFGVISGHNVLDRNISGIAKGSINTKFNADTLNISSFNLDVKQFRLKRDEVDLKINPNKNAIIIENGSVKKWDIGFTDGSEYFNSKGYNTENKSIVLEQSFNIKSNILELLSDFVEKSRGNIKGNNQIVINKDITFKEFKISSNNGSLKFKKIPGFITNLNYEIIKNGNRFELQKLIGKYGEGDFKSNGYLIFDDLFPLVNLEFKVDRSIIPVFKKSTVMLSASGLITGTELPYNLNSKATILQGEILDDPADIVSDSKVSLSEYNKYLPAKSDGSSTGYMNLNVSFDTQNNVAIKNNMAEVYFKANGNINGTIINPEIITKVDVLPTISKFKFKGHDFLLNQGNLEIQDKGKVRNSQMKFVGLARVNEYDVKLDISGKLDKMDIVLSSEPYSSQEDILSLLTIGVTSDMNKNLDPTERAAITRLGIGTMFLNQLKINEDINNTIGVNVSVLPEFQEEDSSLVAGGKSAVSESSTSKLKSATKIKINKKITNKLDVSVSSTVGGSIEQKQEMNANYNVNKNMSVEGVYEIKPAEDESTATPTSLGIDLKFKWSF
jgi:translocation and assembly module TamB